MRTLFDINKFRAIDEDGNQYERQLERLRHARKQVDCIEKAVRGAVENLREARRLTISEALLPWIDECEETTKFTKYWFAPLQRNTLRKLAYLLMQTSGARTRRLNDLYWLALSRTIITKHAGASLAWDVPHSRPHKVKQHNDFDVLKGFVRAVETIATTLDSEPVPRDGRVYRGDGRKLDRLTPSSVDAIFSSPPYLNAIDYLRGHKFSLIWMGHTIPELRRLRSISVGAERAPDEEAPQQLCSAARSVA